MKTLNSQCRYILRIDHLNGQIERFQNSNFHSEVFLQLLTNTNMVLFPLLNIYLLIEKASGERGRRKRNREEGIRLFHFSMTAIASI